MLYFLGCTRTTLTLNGALTVRFVGVVYYLIIVVLSRASFIIRLLVMILLFIVIVLIIILLPDMLSSHNPNKPHAHEHAIIWLCPSVALGHLFFIILFVIFFVVLVHCLVVHTKASDTSSVIWDDVSCLKVHWLRHISSSH